MIKRVKNCYCNIKWIKNSIDNGIIPILLISEWSAEQTNNAADEEYYM